MCCFGKWLKKLLQKVIQTLHFDIKQAIDVITQKCNTQ